MKSYNYKPESKPVRAINATAISDTQREVLRTALIEFIYTRCADLDVFAFPDSENEGVFNYISTRYADHTAAFRAAKHREVIHRVRVAKALLEQLKQPNPYIFDPSTATTTFREPVCTPQRMAGFLKDNMTERQSVAKGEQ